MIQSISIKKTATYDEIGTELNDLKKINFIYGANGSGKTTLSNFISNSLDERYLDCSIRWKHDQQLNTLVYNKEFRDKNFGKGSIDGVFTLGQATQEDIIAIENKQDELEKIQIDGTQKKDTLEKQKEALNKEKDDFKDECWKKVYKKHEYDFKEAFKGFMQKESFKEKLLEFNANGIELLTFDELREKSKTIFGKAPEHTLLIKNINFTQVNAVEIDSIWSNKIIGKTDVDIAKIIQKFNLNDWVNQGKSYIQDDDICPFCQEKTITDDFRKQLEEYFDESFVLFTKKIKAQSDKYILWSQNLINELTEIENNQKGNSETKLDVEKFSAYLKTLATQFISNREKLSNKIKEPSRSIELISTQEQLENIEDIIKKANIEIKKHNQIVENYQTERDDLIRSVWRYIVADYKSEIEAYRSKVGGLEKGIDRLSKEHLEKQKQWTDLNNEIKDLTKNVTSIQPTVDEINNILKFYGFLNFEIVPSTIDSNQYQIKREDGRLAESTLSEGEITFLTFLYFLQLTKGATNKDEISQERILVIDDPISSLDSNILFVVSTLIKVIIEDIKNDRGNIKQLILLTHNVYFHKEVSFTDGRNNGDKNTFYWILRKKNKISTFYPYEIKNPIKTSYELLWQELREKDENSCVVIQNIMRRIIENYFKILGNYKDDSLIQKFETQEEKIICKSLISWINDGSHGISDNLFVELQDDSTDKYLKVFENIFIYTNHEGHYNMMMNIENKEIRNAN